LPFDVDRVKLGVDEIADESGAGFGDKVEVDKVSVKEVLRVVSHFEEFEFEFFPVLLALQLVIGRGRQQLLFERFSEILHVDAVVAGFGDVFLPQCARG
jgi:hypothetical protein